MADLRILRAAYRASAADRDDSHPSSADWERLACGELDAASRKDLLEHILDCPECCDIYRALDVLRSGAGAFDAHAPSSPTALNRSSRLRRISWRGAFALAVAAAAVLAVVLPIQRGRDAGVEVGVVVRSADEESELSPIAPVGEVRWHPGDDVVFTWEGSSSKGPFVLEVLGSDGEPVWTAPATDATEMGWAGAAVPESGRYYWRVFSEDSPSTRDESPLVAFDLVNASPP